MNFRDLGSKKLWSLLTVHGLDGDNARKFAIQSCYIALDYEKEIDSNLKKALDTVKAYYTGGPASTEDLDKAVEFATRVKNETGNGKIYYIANAIISCTDYFPKYAAWDAYCNLRKIHPSLEFVLLENTGLLQ